MKKLFTLLGVAVVACIITAGAAQAADWHIHVRFDSGRYAHYSRGGYYRDCAPTYYYVAPVVTYYSYGYTRTYYSTPPVVVYSTPVYYSHHYVPARAYYPAVPPTYYYGRPTRGYCR